MNIRGSRKDVIRGAIASFEHATTGVRHTVPKVKIFYSEDKVVATLSSGEQKTYILSALELWARSTADLFFGNI